MIAPRVATAPTDRLGTHRRNRPTRSHSWTHRRPDRRLRRPGSSERPLPVL